MSKRLYIETYGCQMNVADSELLLGVLGRAGYSRTDEPADADVVLVNTCAVRENAEQRVIGRVGELQRYRRPGTLLGVVGCMAQRLGPGCSKRPVRWTWSWVLTDIATFRTFSAWPQAAGR